jgi:hypothetical protein
MPDGNELRKENLERMRQDAVYADPFLDAVLSRRSCVLAPLDRRSPAAHAEI